MLLVDLVILGVLAYAAWAGWRRGVILVIADLAGLFLALFVAGVAYHPLGVVIAHSFKTIATLGNLAAYAAVFMLVQLALGMVVRLVLRRVPKKVAGGTASRLLGAGLNTLKSAFLIAILLVLVNGLPLSPAVKQPLANAGLSRVLLSWGGRLQGVVDNTIGQNLNDTLNFLTIKPESEESINLGFTTTDVKVDEADETKMLALVNHERTSRGLAPLTINAKAQEVARAHSRDMFARGYFAHIDPDGRDPFGRMEAGGVRFGAAGENLALAPSLDLAHQGLMHSPGHRANILSPDFHAVGIGIIDGGRYGLMVTQDFTD